MNGPASIRAVHPAYIPKPGKALWLPGFMLKLRPQFFRHSGTHIPCLHLDSGFARFARAPE